ncbi:MAG: hypothetical protein ACKO2V_13025 [Snowella sp.]|jgi:hypothetical protein
MIFLEMRVGKSQFLSVVLSDDTTEQNLSGLTTLEKETAPR